MAGRHARNPGTPKTAFLLTASTEQDPAFMIQPQNTSSNVLFVQEHLFIFIT